MKGALYPCYKDLDGFIDLPRLQSLDGFLRNKIESRVAAAKDLAFYTGPFLLNEREPYLPGSKLIFLTKSREPDNYYDLNRPDLWIETDEATEFAPLMDFIRTLPFKARARVIIMYDDSGRPVSAHKDHDSRSLCHEFIWFRTSFNKPFYMLDPGNNEKLYVTSHSAWFDTVNQFHGADETGNLSFSVRVDGVFSDNFRALMPPSCGTNADAPAIWASHL